MPGAKTLVAWMLAVGVVASVTGCSTADVPEALSMPSAAAPSEQNDVQSANGMTDPSVVQLPQGSDALGVVTASLIIATGDISKAVSEGQVTPSEVKYAVMAIQEGTLELWKARAEREQSE